MEIENYTFLQHLKALPFVQQMWIFGSRARGDNQERADIDLAIYCPRASIHEWQHILEIIDEADTLLHIDCVRLDELDDASDLKKAILAQGIKIYELQN